MTIKTLKPKTGISTIAARLGLGYLPIYLLGFLMLALLVLPLGISLLVAFTPGETIEVPAIGKWSLRWFERFFSDPIWQTGAVNSLIIALFTVTIALVCGTTAALAFERYNFPLKRFLNLFILSPLFVPPVVLGIQNLTWHQRIGIWGNLFSIALAHSLWATPLVFIVMRSTLRGLNRQLEEAAAGMGANSFAVFWRITFPLVLPGLLVSAFFSFIISLNEFIMSLFLATPKTQTISTMIWPQLRYNLTPLVAAASAVLLGLTVIILILASRLLSVRRLI
jgi:ABC-type spermidine/putrescine transport system permease subunit II